MFTSPCWKQEADLGGTLLKNLNSKQFFNEVTSII